MAGLGWAGLGMVWCGIVMGYLGGGRVRYGLGSGVGRLVLMVLFG